MISFSMLSITLSVEVRQMIIDQAPCNHSFRNFLNPEVNYSMHAKPLTENEILKYCSAITTQAVGYDDISPGILKLGIQFISKPLTYLVNQSFKSGSFPEELKTAKVIAIHKCYEHNLCLNVCSFHNNVCFQVEGKIFFTVQFYAFVHDCIFI